MRNKYPGICYFCGKVVEKGRGHFERRGSGPNPNWATIHAECVFIQRKLKAEAKECQQKK